MLLTVERSVTPRRYGVTDWSSALSAGDSTTTFLCDSRYSGACFSWPSPSAVPGGRGNEQWRLCDQGAARPASAHFPITETHAEVVSLRGAVPLPMVQRSRTLSGSGRDRRRTIIMLVTACVQIATHSEDKVREKMTTCSTVVSSVLQVCSTKCLHSMRLHHYSSGITKWGYCPCVCLDICILKGLTYSFHCTYVIRISNVTDLKKVTSLRGLVDLFNRDLSILRNFSRFKKKWKW